MSTMKKEEILDHWTNWAKTYGTGLNATTKTPTLKALELDVLARHLDALGYGAKGAHVLEVGCGNGKNCVGLAMAFPSMKLDGMDYVPEMVASALENANAEKVSSRVKFFQGNVLELDKVTPLAKTYDAIFTDRCLINLNKLEDQLKAMTELASRVRPGGHLLMVENSMLTYNRQNHYRELAGLPPRTPAAYNLFFDEEKILPHLTKLGFTIEIEDFISLHDLLLYVLVPAINGGTVDYDHPIVAAATKLSIAVSAETPNAFGAHGQNRLYRCRKAA